MIQPLGNRVLVKADKAATKSKLGILLSEQWKTRPGTGTILAIGDEVDEIKVGDRVAYERYSAVILDDDERLLSAHSIIARLEDEEGA